MGLDAVELVLALEEGFGAAISDAEAEACVTPALVTDLIFGKLRAADERVCVSQRAFYLLRKGLIQIADVSRRNVTLNADVRLIAAGRPEQQFWQDLQTTVQARSCLRWSCPSGRSRVYGPSAAVCSAYSALPAIGLLP